MPGRVLFDEWRRRYPSAPYLIPFGAFAASLIFFQWIKVEPTWLSAIRVLALGAVAVICWPAQLSWRPSYWFASIAVGLLVFLLWIAPDTLIAGYRSNWLFSNPITGHVHSSILQSVLKDPWYLFWRTTRAVLVVPIVEELFWRAWMMRWLISSDFEKVPFGAYSTFSFWIAAALFASEHGPYWDVGLIAGVIYNSWMIRTKSVADCILMHAVTNGALSAYVITTQQWQYWQ